MALSCCHLTKKGLRILYIRCADLTTSDVESRSQGNDASGESEGNHRARNAYPDGSSSVAQPWRRAPGERGPGTVGHVQFLVDRAQPVGDSVDRVVEQPGRSPGWLSTPGHRLSDTRRVAGEKGFTAQRSSNCFSARQLAARAPSINSAASLAGSPSASKVADYASSAWLEPRSCTAQQGHFGPRSMRPNSESTDFVRCGEFSKE